MTISVGFFRHCCGTSRFAAAGQMLPAQPLDALPLLKDLAVSAGMVGAAQRHSIAVGAG